MLQRLRNLWNNYKYRLVPWVSIQLYQNGKKDVINGSSVQVTKINHERQHNVEAFDTPKIKNFKPLKVHHVSVTEDSAITDKQLRATLENLFSEFIFPSSPKCTEKEMKDVQKRNCEIMRDKLGFHIEKGKSVLGPNAGTGVFVRNGSVKAGSLVALYPGTIYLPSEPLFFASIKNQFIFRCKTGILIDGNDRRLSKTIYTSCARRDQFGFEIPCCDVSWLSVHPINPLNMGQYVNNGKESFPHNVIYQECYLPPPGCPDKLTLPIHLWRYLPNVWYDAINNDIGLKLVPLVAVRDIEDGEEIFSSYFTVVHG